MAWVKSTEPGREEKLKWPFKFNRCWTKTEPTGQISGLCRLICQSPIPERAFTERYKIKTATLKTLCQPLRPPPLQLEMVGTSRFFVRTLLGQCPMFSHFLIWNTLLGNFRNRSLFGNRACLPVKVRKYVHLDTPHHVRKFVFL